MEENMKVSCTTLDGWNPINSGINHLSTGAGFLPSTVVVIFESIIYDCIIVIATIQLIIDNCIYIYNYIVNITVINDNNYSYSIIITTSITIMTIITDVIIKDHQRCYYYHWRSVISVVLLWLMILNMIEE